MRQAVPCLLTCTSAGSLHKTAQPISNQFLASSGKSPSKKKEANFQQRSNRTPTLLYPSIDQDMWYIPQDRESTGSLITQSLAMYLMLIPGFCNQVERFAFIQRFPVLRGRSSIIRTQLTTCLFSWRSIAMGPKLLHKLGRQPFSLTLLKMDFGIQIGSYFSQVFDHACALIKMHYKVSKQKLYSSPRSLSIKILSEPCILQQIAVSALLWKHESK